MLNLQQKVPAAASCSSTRRASRGRSVHARAALSPNAVHLNRRNILEGLALTAGSMVLGSGPAFAAKPATVGSYLPPAGIEDFALFVPDAQKTPAIRAATVDPSNPYRFAIPPSWRESKVANIQSGNYCQPRCAEPWTEVIFEDEAEGRLQVIVSPLVRLTNRKDAPIEELGTPDEILQRVGPFITGTYLDEEDIISSQSKVLDDKRTYYYYEINATYGTVGPHTITACTTKGALAYLFVVSANDKQWAKNQAKLRTVVDSFRA